MKSHDSAYNLCNFSFLLSKLLCFLIKWNGFPKHHWCNLAFYVIFHVIWYVIQVMVNRISLQFAIIDPMNRLYNLLLLFSLGSNSNIETAWMGFGTFSSRSYFWFNNLRCDNKSIERRNIFFYVRYLFPSEQ